MGTFLSKYLGYKKICIQCHDNPDADAVASGLALYRFYKGKGIDTRFIYGGKRKITKPNLIMMVDKLDIPIEYETESIDCDLLITTDCRYGESNVAHFDAPKVVVIDHHQTNAPMDEDCLIRSNLASCSTIVWDLLLKEGYDVNADQHLATALYYGLYTDSSAFEELYHPMDRDMRDLLERDDKLIFRLVNTNLSVDEMGVTSRALVGQVISDDRRYSVIEAEECDPNILGVISDFVIQVDRIDTCIAYNPNQGGYKLSVRSCVNLTKANELAEFVCRGLGGGGGHINKAGGFISASAFEKEYGDKSMTDYLCEKLDEYYDMYEVIHAAEYDIDTSDMLPYVKKPFSIGYVKASDILSPGTPILIRTLEGDVERKISMDLYLMIGIEGEVYPIMKEKFLSSYEPTEAEPDITFDYEPTIRDTVYGETYKLTDYMKPCVSTGVSKIYAKKLTTCVKVFTAWDKDRYYRGEIGDYLAVREDDMHDIYVIRGHIFDKTYEPGGDR